MECIIFVAGEVWYLIPGRWSMMELAGEDKTSCSITEPSLPHFPIPTLGTSQAWVNRVQITCHTQVNQSPPPAAAVEIILFICIYLFYFGVEQVEVRGRNVAKFLSSLLAAPVLKACSEIRLQD